MLAQKLLAIYHISILMCHHTIYNKCQALCFSFYIPTWPLSTEITPKVCRRRMWMVGKHKTCSGTKRRVQEQWESIMGCISHTESGHTTPDTHTNSFIIYSVYFRRVHMQWQWLGTPWMWWGILSRISKQDWLLFWHLTSHSLPWLSRFSGSS